MRALIRPLSLIVALTVGGAAGAGNVDLPRFPAISPDGSQITFSWRGDLWKVAATGGTAVRLTAHPSVDTRSAWSHDGRRIAFESERDGASNLFLMNADGSEVRQITATDRPCILSGFSHDDSALLFHSSREGDVYRASRPYRVMISGGPIERVMGSFGESPAPSPGGELIAFERGGSSWSRRHYRGPDNRDLWLFNTADTGFRRLTDWVGNDGKAHWIDADSIVFASDREFDTVNLFAMDVSAPERPRRLTAFEGRDVWDFDVSRNGRTAVMVVWDTLYTLDLPGALAGTARPIALDVNASADASDSILLKSVADQATEAALSPDGKALAVVAYGEVFVRGLEDDSPTARVTRTHAREHDIAWSPDGATLYFVSDTDGTDSIYAATVAQTRADLKKALLPPVDPSESEPAPQAAEEPEPAADPEPDAAPADQDPAAPEGDAEEKADDKKPEKKKDEPTPGERWADAVRFEIAGVVTSEFNDVRPTPSPDGKTLAFVRTRGDLVLLDLETRQERLYRASWDSGIDFQWSPDSRHLAWSVNDRDFNSDVWIAPADDATAAVNISRHPDSDSSPRWSADGKVLAFLSDRQNNESDVWMVFLDRGLDSLSGRELGKYFEKAGKDAKARKPLELPAPAKAEAAGDAPEAEKEAAPEPEPLDLEDAYLRLRRVTSYPGDENGLLITPSGERLIFNRAGTDGGAVSVKWDGSELKKLGDSASLRHVSLTGDKVVLVRGRRAGTVGAEGADPKTFAVSGTLRIDLREQSAQKFAEAARILSLAFYHPTMKGLEWDDLTARYADLARRAHTNDEFDDVASRLLGELNASHLGVMSSGDGAPAAQANGRLGIDAEPVEEGWRVKRVLPRGPGDNGEMSLRQGDVITAIEFEPVSPRRELEELLKGMAGDEIAVTVLRASDDAAPAREVTLLVRPVSYGRENDLRYEDWQRSNARLVDEWSGGRIGYLHIRSMGAESLVEFERDLYAAANGKDGLLIDVRNNGGGWTADLVMASLTYKPHAYTIPRGADPDEPAGYPRDRLFIQRYAGPANMLCNEKSFSNAEIVSHAFKTLGRGTLVGQRTYGGVISTGGTSLIDGTFVRVPFRGWYLPDGTDMENHGATPDILVPQTPEDESAGMDRQLRAAVDDLMSRLP